MHIVCPASKISASFDLCTRSEFEEMHAVLAVLRDNTFLVTHLVPLRYSQQAVDYVCADHQTTHALMINAHEWGEHIIGMIHSHPGSGPNSNFPSQIDASTQEDWEKHAPFITGIWSRDGYLRFFTNDTPFTVEIIGHHVEQNDETSFRLTRQTKEILRCRTAPKRDQAANHDQAGSDSRVEPASTP